MIMMKIINVTGIINVIKDHSGLLFFFRFFYNDEYRGGFMKTKIRQYDQNIYAIDQEMVRSFVIIGEKQALIIDAGAQSVDFMSYVREMTSLPVKLCLSHSDHDHTANLDQFDEVYIHEDEIPFLQQQNIKMNVIHEGDVFDLGGRELEVIHVPGHTPGSICLWDRQHHQLFSGDTVSYGPVYMFGSLRHMDDYIASLTKLQSMLDKQVTIFPCHNTCPIKVDVISQLLSCCAGIKSHQIQGEASHIAGVLLYQYQQCGILRLENE